MDPCGYVNDLFPLFCQINVAVKEALPDAAPGPHSDISMQELKTAFTQLDANRDGFIDAKELNGVLKNLDRCGGCGAGLGCVKTV